MLCLFDVDAGDWGQVEEGKIKGSRSCSGRWCGGGQGEAMEMEALPYEPTGAIVTCNNGYVLSRLSIATSSLQM